MAYETLEVSVQGQVGIIKFDRPKALNALCKDLADELAAALQRFSQDDAIGCVILTGSEKSFAAGADIKEMQADSYVDLFMNNRFEGFAALEQFRKPVIAAVSGYALGGGCEIAMMCDFIICADTAKFGQPEINLGVMPGIGGTQRLIRAVGKSKAMDLCLTGRMMDAKEAERCGLVSRVVASDMLIETATEAADKIASQSRFASMMTKETLNVAFETTLSQGLQYERRLFQSMFTTHDQKEGMSAFIDKRKPHFKNK